MSNVSNLVEVPIIIVEDDQEVIDALNRELTKIAPELQVAFSIKVLSTLDTINSDFGSLVSQFAHSFFILILTDKVEEQEVAASLALLHSDSLENALVIDNSPNGLGMVSVENMVETQQRAFLVGRAVREAITGRRTQS